MRVLRPPAGRRNCCSHAPHVARSACSGMLQGFHCCPTSGANKREWILLARLLNILRKIVENAEQIPIEIRGGKFEQLPRLFIWLRNNPRLGLLPLLV